MHYLDTKLINFSTRLRNSALFQKKPGEKTIIMEITIIVIGVAVALIFKDKILEIVNNMSSRVESNISGIFGGTP